MKRVLPLLFVAVVVLSCQDDQPTPTSPTFVAPQADISDGANGGNPHFYWLPELVESPTYTGTFNPDLPATVRLCELVSNTNLICVAGSETVLFGPADVTVSLENEQYSAVWHTKDSSLTPGAFYRLSVSIGTRELGYRDLNPLENPPSPIDKSAPFYAFNNGNTINIKFRIEDGALCEGDGPCGECYLQTDGTGGNNPEFFPTGGDPSACNADPGLGVQIPAGVLPEPVVVIVERVACGPAQSDGRVNFFPYLDLPQYGGCFTARTEPVLEGPIDFATVGVCVDVNGLSADQEAKLLLHQTADRNNPGDEIKALNNVAADFVDCDAFAAAQTPALLRWAQRGWDALNPFSAAPAYATHQGKGGDIIGFSDFVWALPAQQEILEGDGQTARVGTAVAVPPAVRVTDEEGVPVTGARVTFRVTEAQNGGAVVPVGPIVTGSDGVARVTSWTLGSDVGINVLAASGRGIGIRGDTWTQSDGRKGVGPFAHSTLTFVPSGPSIPATLGAFPLVLQQPDLLFTAYGCDLGQGTADVSDGLKDASWDCANTEPFTANLSGGKKDATFYWMHDGDTFYFAVSIPVDETASESENIWTLYLTDTGNPTLTGGDDVLLLDGATQAFSDQSWAEGKCPKGDSFCAFVDANQNGAGHFRINVNPDGSAFYFYELAHELQGDPYQDIAVTGKLGAAFTLRVGKGAKGNTEWPGPFGSYRQIIP